MAENRYNQTTNYLPAISPSSAQPARAYPVDVGRDATILDLSSALQPQDLHEKTGPLGRSIAFAVRMALLMVLLGALALGLLLVIVLGKATGWALLVFSALAIGGYYILSKLDFDHSPAGVEKDKIQAVKEVALDKQRGERALRREVMRSYLRTMAGGDDA